MKSQFGRGCRVVTSFMLPLLLFFGCTGLPGDECGQQERAVLAEFPLHENRSVRPEYNPKHSGCVLVYTTTSSPEEVLAYFVEQWEAHGWKGAPHFASEYHSMSAYRDYFSYGIFIYKGQMEGQELPPDAHIVSITVTELESEQDPEFEAGPIPDFEPDAKFDVHELTREELEQFAGEYGTAGSVEAVVTLVDDHLQVRPPGGLANVLIPVSPTRFRIEDFSEAFSVEFESSNGQSSGMKIEQTFTAFHNGGSMQTQLQLQRME